LRAIVHHSTVDGLIKSPPSKSYTHRAIVCGLLSSHTTKIRNPLFCADTEATLQLAQMMGAKVKRGKDLELIGPQRLQAPTAKMDCQGSGTTLRIFTALSALTDGRCVLTGDHTLRKRPIGELLKGLRQLGTKARSTNGNDRPPVEIQGSGVFEGVVRIPGDISSQYITGLLFACSKGSGDTRIELTTHLESRSYVEMTLDIMRQFGADAHPSNTWNSLKILGNQEYGLSEYLVEGDYSSAAFLMAAGALTGRVILTGLQADSVQGDARIIALLRMMGLSVDIDDKQFVINSHKLKAIEVDASNIPDLVPVLTVLATQAKGTTRIYNAGRLREKESDRLSSVSQELRKLGAIIEESKDSLMITGPTALQGAELDSHNDHRVAMAGVIAGLIANESTIMNNIECVSKSYPDFIHDLRMIGAYIELDNQDNKVKT
jgi:3-phosphoshikimate 1-carboxyvinyltransferase